MNFFYFLGVYDRIRTCVYKCHKLAPKPLGHRLHMVAPDGLEPPLADSKSAVLTITPWGIICRALPDYFSLWHS